MASYEVAERKIGAYVKTLAATTVDTVTFNDDCESVEVRSNGAAAIYYTVDGSTPTVGGSNCYELPAIPSARAVGVPTAGKTVVKLISPGTPEYSVSKA